VRTSEKTDALMPALLKARVAMKPAFKGKKNDHFRYNYANEEAWHDAVQPHLHENDLLLTFSVGEYGRTGSLSMVRGTARVTHAASGQWLEIDGVGEGEDKADKGAYKAQTGLKKYLYALAFSLPTTDDAEDPENDKRRAADEVKAKVVAANPAAGTAEVNAALVAEGHAPQKVDPEVRARAKALFEQAKLIDYSDANRIKRQWGTDYERMAEELDLFIAGAPKKG
jgi:hypothetical protein